ncbi:hypothetical protein, partial [Caulobacter sp. 17J65-9]|uniref:hypothetical protein n=1 Tax=Caulobacter sp. 17J65-9 TaxID=2709382 RepID=UPI0013C82F77
MFVAIGESVRVQGESTETEAAWTPPPETLAARLRAEGVPVWLPEVIALLRGGLDPAGDHTLAYDLTRQAPAWSQFDAASWAQLERGLHDDAVAAAQAYADAAAPGERKSARAAALAAAQAGDLKAAVKA